MRGHRPLEGSEDLSSSEGVESKQVGSLSGKRCTCSLLAGGRGLTPLEAAKKKLTIPALWELLGLPGSPGRSCRSPFRKDRKPSFSVRDDGRLFSDFGYPEHKGDAVDFLRLARGLSPADAAREFIRLAGCEPPSQMPAARLTLAPEARDTGKGTRSPDPMPESVAEAWREGLAHLAADAGAQRAVADARGWPVAFVASLCESGLLARPQYHGRRGLAFPVTYPRPRGPEQIGWHFRFDVRGDGARPGWVFAPNAKEHGRGVPAVPFIMGEFGTARLLIACEGQWDALTFALAAGWLSHDAAWPEGVCLLGIRGAQGVRPFFDAYGPLWPDPMPNVLLLPDADSAGRTWFEARGTLEEPLADRLAGLARKVAVVQCHEAKDFNEAFKAEPIGPAEIGALLKSHGFTDAKGRIL